MKNVIGIALIIGGVSLLVLGPRMFGPWWAVGGFSAFVLGFVVAMDAAKSRRVAQSMRTDVAVGGDGTSSHHGGISHGGSGDDSGAGDH